MVCLRPPGSALTYRPPAKQTATPSRHRPQSGCPCCQKPCPVGGPRSPAIGQPCHPETPGQSVHPVYRCIGRHWHRRLYLPVHTPAPTRGDPPDADARWVSAPPSSQEVLARPRPGYRRATATKAHHPEAEIQPENQPATSSTSTAKRRL